MPRAFGESGAVRPLIDLDGQSDGGDLQCAQVPARVVEVLG